VLRVINKPSEVKEEMKSLSLYEKLNCRLLELKLRVRLEKLTLIKK